MDRNSVTQTRTLKPFIKTFISFIFFFYVDVLNTAKAYCEAEDCATCTVNNKCGRKKHIYNEKDRHQATQT